MLRWPSSSARPTCGSAPRSSARATNKAKHAAEAAGSPDHDPRAGAESDEKPAKALRRERDAARGGAKSGAREVHKDRAAAAGNARARVVIELDEQVVEIIVAPQPVACRIGGQLDRPVVAAVARVLAPGVGLADAAHGEARARAGCAVPAPPQANEPE